MTACDFALSQTVTTSQNEVGDTACFKINVINQGGTATTAMTVSDKIPAGSTFVSASAEKGSYNSATGVWSVGDVLATDDTLTLTLKVKITQPGVLFNLAEISEDNCDDTDSTPNNGVLIEDDIASACVSVPIYISVCKNDSVRLTAPGGHSNYQWFRDNVAIMGATDSIYKASSAGDYTFTTDLNPSGCSGGNCCPVSIRERLCLGDFVWNDKNNDGQQGAANVEPGIPNVEVLLYSPGPNGAKGGGDDVLIAKDTTDAAGKYLFTDLKSGDYYVKLSGTGIPAQFVSSTGDGPADTDGAGAYENNASQDPDSNPSNTDDNGSQMGAMVMTPIITLTLGGETGDGDSNPNSNPSVDFGLYKLSYPPDVVYDTLPVTDFRKLCSSSDNLPNVDTTIYFVCNPDGVLNGGTLSTDPTTGCPIYTAGNNPGGAVDTICVVGIDSLGHPDTTTFIITITPKLSLGDLVWNDKNNNGQQDSGENGIPNVVVWLFDAGPDGVKGTADDSPTAIKTTTTDGNGNYLFESLAPGNYYVKLTGGGIPQGFVSSTGDGPADNDGAGAYENQASQDPDTNPSNTDDNGSQMGKMVMSPVITLTVGGETGDGDSNPNHNPSVDFGLYFPVFPPDVKYDTIPVTEHTGPLCPTADNLTNVASINVVACDGPTPPDFGTFTTDANGCAIYTAGPTAGGAVDTICVIAIDSLGRMDTTKWIITITPKLSLGDLVWNDKNNNGQQDSGENGIPNVVVWLFDAGPDGVKGTADDSPTAIKTTTTDGNGNYLFESLAPGNYYVKLTGGGIPQGFVSSTGDGPADNDGAGAYENQASQDPDSNPSNTDDNGSQMGKMVMSPVITLTVGGETGDGDSNPNHNPSVDFGLYFPVFPPDVKYDTIPVTEHTGPLCPTADDLTNVSSINVVACDGPTPPDFGTFTTDANGCAIYTAGPTPGGAVDTICVIAIDSLGRMDTTKWIITITPKLSLGDLVWNDKNNNGQQDSGENGIPNVVVWLFDAGPDGVKGTADDSPTAIKTTTTDGNGNHLFESLAPGNYYVKLTGGGIPQGFVSSTGDGPADNDGAGAYENQASQDPDSNPSNTDDNGSQMGKMVMSPVITLTVGGETGDGDSNPNHNPSVDFGLYFPVFPPDVKYDTIPVTEHTGPLCPTADNLTNVASINVVACDGPTPPDFGTFTTDANGCAIYTAGPTPGGAVDTICVIAIDSLGRMDTTKWIITITPKLSLGDLVWNDKNNNGQQDSGENGIPNVVVWLFDAGPDGVKGTADDSPTAIKTTTTDGNGNYLFESLAPGNYYVKLTGGGIPTGFVSSTGDGPADNDGAGAYENQASQDPDTNPSNTDDNGSQMGAMVMSPVITLTIYGETGDGDNDSNKNPSVDFGLYAPTAALGDHVFYDDNKDGVQGGPNDGPVANVVVLLYDAGPDGIKGNGDDGGLVAKDTTDSNGNYLFEGLLAGNYYVVFDTATLPNGFIVTGQHNSGNTATDSDANGMGMTDVVNLSAGEVDLTVDLGIQPVTGLATIGNFVWYDDDRDGIQDPNETAGVPNVTVQLFDAGPDGIKGNGDDGGLVATTTTGPNGMYMFTDLNPGNYYLMFNVGTLPLNYTVSNQNQGGNGGLDSDGNPISGMTVVTHLDENEIDLTWDLGVSPLPASLGDVVFYDSNGSDGVQQMGENGVPNVVVILYNLGTDGAKGGGDDQIVAKDTTDATGHYLFTNLTPGNYYVQFDLTTLPNGYGPTGQNLGGNDATDSDANAMGMDDVTNLSPNETDLTHDLGIVPTGIFDLALKKTLVSPLTGVLPGQTAVFKVTILNQGTVAANTISATDFVPTGMTFQPSANWTDNGNGTATYNSTTSLAPTASIDVLINLKVNANATAGTLVNKAEIASATNDFNLPDVDSQPDTNPNNDAGGNPNSPSDDSVNGNGSGTPGDSVAATDEDDEDPATVQILAFAQIGNYVFYDNDYSNTQTAGDGPVSNVTVQLFSVGPNGMKGGGDDVLFGTQTTVGGYYLFTGLPPGDYYVMFDLTTLPANYTVVAADQGGNDALDSDGNAMGMTNVYSLVSGDSIPTVDLGIQPLPASLGDYVFHDNNGNGQQDAGDNGIPNIQVTLYNLGNDGAKGGGDDQIVLTTTTDGTGHYSFNNLPPGSYYVQFNVANLPIGSTISPQNAAGVDPTLNSDGNAMGMTNVVTLAPGENNPNIDLGVVPPACDVVLSADIINAACGQSNGSISLTITGGVPSYTIAWLDGSTAQNRTNLTAGIYKVTVTDAAGCSRTATYMLNNAGGPTATSTAVDSKCTTADGSIDVTVSGGTPPISYLWNNGATTEDLNNLGAGTYDLTITDGNGCVTMLEETIDAPCSSIGNFVWYDDGDGIQEPGELGVQNVSITLFNTTDGVKGNGNDVQVGLPILTDGNGLYLFPNLDAGSYYIVFNLLSLPTGYVPTTANVGNDAFDSDASTASMGMSAIIVLPSNFNDLTTDLGIVPLPASLGDLVFYDLNGNGIQDGGAETGVPNVTVNLVSVGPNGVKGGGDDFIYQTMTTNGSGNYLFSNLPIGDYYVQFDLNTLPNNYHLTTQDANGNTSDALDSDGNAMGMTIATNLAAGETDLTWDLGIVPNPASLGDFVFYDNNGNGVQNGGTETGVPNIHVTIFNTVDGIKGNGNDVQGATVVTDGTGHYSFTNLAPGTYYVVFNLADLPANYTISPQNNGGNGALDSDANLMGMTAAVTLGPGDNNPDLDLGIVPLASIGDFVWYDLNGNGIQDGGAEAGVPNVHVSLYNTVDGIKGNGNDFLVNTTTTDGNGHYSFTGLQAGEYYIVFNLADIPAHFQLTGQDANANGSDASDSDANAMGMTVATTLSPGENDLTWDMGITPIPFDLALVKKLASGQAAIVHPGDAVNFSIQVINQGGEAAFNVEITDYIPAGFVFIPANNPSWTLDAPNNRASMTLAGPLNPLASTTVLIQLQVAANALGSVLNAAEISSADNDNNPSNGTPTDVDSHPDKNPTNDTFGGNDVTNNANNDEDDHDTEPITVISNQIFDLALWKTLAPSQSVFVNPGDLATYRIFVKNQGEVTAANVVVTDYLPAQTTLADPDWTAVGVDKATYQFAGTFAPGEVKFVDITVHIIGDPSGNGAAFVNFAEISSETDGNGNPVTDVDSHADNNPNNDVVAGPMDNIDNIDGDEDDHDYEVLIDLPKYDPIGFVYCDKTGKIIMGGEVTITPPKGGAVYYVNGLTGLNGIYQWYTDGTPGVYTMTYSHPNGYPISATCTAQPGPFDPTGMDGVPGVDMDGVVDGFVTLGQDSSGGYVVPHDCLQNPYFLDFKLDDVGDPEIRHNNIPVSCVLIASIACEDTDGDDHVSAGDTPIPFTTVYLYDCQGNKLDSVLTDALGHYRFDGLEAGSYEIGYNIPNGKRPIIYGPIHQDGFSDCITLDWGQCDTTTVICLHLCPTLDAGKDVSICSGDNTQLNVNYPTVTWSPDYNISDIHIPNPIVYPEYTTTYTVSYDDDYGCVGEDQVVVNVLCSPTISEVVVENAYDCVNPEGSITVSASTNYDCDLLYSLDGVKYQTSSIFEHLPAGDYTVYVKTEDGCEVTEDVTIYGTEPAFYHYAPDYIYMCTDDLAYVYYEVNQPIVDINITGTAGYLPPSYVTDSSFFFIATLNGLFETFHVSITTASGCVLDSTFYLVRISEPEADFIPILPACSNDSVCFKFTGTSSPDAQLLWNVADGQIIYSSPADGTNPAGANICVKFPSAGFRMIMLVVDDGGCIDQHIEGVLVRKPPVANAGKDTMVCKGYCVQLNGTQKGGVACFWQPDPTLSDPTIHNPIACPTKTTAYIFCSMDGDGCMGCDTVVVMVKEAKPDAGFDTDICFGDCAEFTASGGGTYLWSNGATAAHIIVCPTVNTTYFVTVTATNGCTGIDSVHVFVHPLPTVDAGTDKDVCKGECATLLATASPANSTFQFEWSNGSILAISNVCPTKSTEYYVTVTDENGCQASDSVRVNVLPNPTADAGPDKGICKGDCTILTASGGSTYLWNNGFTTASITVCPTKTTTYTVTVTDSHGCTDEDEVTVNVHSIIADAGPDQWICKDGCIMLVGNGTPTPTSYLWSNGATTQMTFVCPTVMTEYILTVTDVYGCTDSDTTKVNIYPGPDADAWPDTVLCAPGCVILHASGGVSYTWLGAGLNNPSLQNPKACVNATTNYIVIVTDANGCIDTAHVSIQVIPFVGNAGADQTICLGECADLTASGGVSYLWNTGATTATLHVCPTTTTTYHVTITNSNGCTDDDDVVVTVNPVPNPNLGSGQTICAGETATLTASGGGTYLWSTGATTASISVSPTATTTYSVTVTNSFGCSATGTTVIIVKPLPTPNAGADVTICLSACTTLTATGGGTYLWSNGATTTSTTVCPTSTTTYTVTVTGNNGCTATDQVVVTVENPPAANAGPDQSICAGNSATLTASGGGTYLWSTGATTASITVSPAMTTTYTVTVTSPTGCTATDQVVVTVHPLPTATINPGDVALCPGSCIWLQAFGGVTYAWSGAGLNSYNTDMTLACPSATTTYVVTVTDANGCTDTEDVVVTIKPGPTADAGPDQSICVGQCANLTATGGVSYLWSNGATTASTTVCPTVPTIYTVTVYGPNGCFDDDVVLVNIGGNITATAGPSQTICLGQSATLTATGGGTYLWNTGATTASITVSPSSTQVYSVSVFNSTGCMAMASATVTVNFPPAANAGSDQTICAGKSATLTASGGGTYLWSNGATTASTTVSPSSTTIYTVTVTSGAGCTATDQVQVTISNPPTANAGADQTICSGACATLTATGGGSYFWNTGATTASIQVCPTVTTTYTVTVSNSNGCTATDQVVVSIGNNPTANAGPDQTICAGNSATLTASGGGTYLWSNGATTASTTVSPTTTTTYSVTVTNAAGCTATDQVQVSVNPAPTANAGPDVNICTGSTANLTASGGGTYLWSNGATTASTSVSPSTTTTYTVTVTSAAGCTATDQVTVTVNQTPTANAGADQTICSGNSATLTASGGGSYLWSNGATTASTTVSPTVNTTYTVTVTSTTGCTATDQVNVTVNQTPTANAGADQTICSGNSATLTASGGGSYLWSNGATTASTSVSPISTTTYTVTVTSTAGCTATDQVTVNVNQTPTANAGPDQTICFGKNATLTASGGGSYLWSNGATTASTSVSPTTTTTYTVTVTAQNGCTATDQVVVTVDNPTANAGPDQSLCIGNSATLTATGGSSYLWNTGATTASITVSPTSTTTYSVTVTSTAGCTATDQVVVTVHPKPTATIQPPTVALCPGSCIWLAAGGGVTYQWSGAGLTIYNQDSTLACPQVTTTYVVTVTDVNGCTDTEETTVIIKPGPTANAGADQTICAGQCANLAASGGVSYLWSNGATTAATQVCPTTATNFTVTVTGTNGCTAIDNVLVNTSGTINASAGPDQTICSNQTATLTASGGTSYLWNNGATTASIQVSPAGTTTYSVTVTNAGGCSGTDQVTVTVTNSLTIVSQLTPPSCNSSNGSIQLSVTGGSGSYIYGWSPNVSTSSTASNLAAGSYHVTVTDLQGGCSATATIDLPNSSAPSVTLTATSAVCTNANGAILVGISGGSAPYQVKWNGPSGGTTNGASSPYNISSLAAGAYSVTVTDGGGCSMVQSVTVQQTQSQLTVLTNNTIPASCTGAADGQIVVIINGTGTAPYSISVDGTLAASNISTNPTMLNGYAGGVHNVVVTDANGCTKSATVTVNQNPSPTLTPNDVTTTNPTCFGATNGSITSIYTVQVYSGTTLIGNVPQNHLAAGAYIIKRTENGCETSITVVLSQPASVAVSTTHVDANCCGKNGSATASATGGTGNFTFIWNSGQTTASISGLDAGNYLVTATDANGCTGSTSVAIGINCNQCTDIVSTETVNATEADTIPVCLPLTTSAIGAYEILVDGQPYNTTIHGCDYDSITAYSYAALLASTNAPNPQYRLDSWTFHGGTKSNVLFNSIQQLVDSMHVWDPPASTWILDAGATSIVGGHFQFAATYGPMKFTTIDNSIKTTLNPNYILVSNGSEILVPGTPGKHTIILIDPTTCCRDTVCVIVEPISGPCGNFIQNSNVSLTAAACNLLVGTCVSIPNAEILNYTITDNGAAYVNGFSGCDFDTTYNYLTTTIPGGGNSGPYSVTWTINGTPHNGSFISLAGLVNFMNVVDPTGTWTYHASSQTIAGGVNGVNYGNLAISGGGGMASIQPNTAYNPHGTELKFGVGLHQVIFTSGPCADTLTVNVTCPEIQDTVLNFTISKGATQTYCLGILVNNGATITSITNNCPQNAGDVTFSINNQTLCVSFTGNAVGSGQACLSVCLSSGQCFNVTLNVTVNDLPNTSCQIVTDEAIVISVGDCAHPSGQFCVDIPIASIGNYGIDLDGAPYTGFTKTCDYNGNGAGTGTLLGLNASGSHLFVFTDLQKNCHDTLVVEGKCFLLTPQFKEVTIYVGDKDTVCLDISELPGTIFSTQNACPAVNGFVFFEQQPGTVCYLCTGIEVGTESVCFVLCDDKGFCDSTFMIVHVLDRDLRIPVAVNDIDTTITNVPIVVAVLPNDTIPGVLTTMTVITQPLHGTAFRNPTTNTITYMPAHDYCDENTPDYFTYSICNPLGCDTATVAIITLCDKIKIYNGFSPNGDGLNDVFFIEGLQNVPNNELTVYNRWGNRIYYKKKYDNSWDGTWDNLALPDGTYFYIFDAGDGSKPYSGYLQIQR